MTRRTAAFPVNVPGPNANPRAAFSESALGDVASRRGHSDVRVRDTRSSESETAAAVWNFRISNAMDRGRGDDFPPSTSRLPANTVVLVGSVSAGTNNTMLQGRVLTRACGTHGGSYGMRS
jgi:hypothetical protein